MLESGRNNLPRHLFPVGVPVGIRIEQVIPGEPSAAVVCSAAAAFNKLNPSKMPDLDGPGRIERAISA